MSLLSPAFYSPGPLEVAIILVVVLIVFGPGKLPDVFRALGSGMRQFKEAANPEQFAAKALDAPASTPAVTATEEPTTAASVPPSA